MKRIALCIGIAEYDFALNLRNPVNDAQDIGVALKDLGFEVLVIDNSSRVEMLRAIKAFQQQSIDSEVSLVYFAGHGLQCDGINYLVPSDANPQNETELDIYCINANELVIQDKPQENKVNLYIFDACRDNPFSRSWSRSNNLVGFAPILAPSGTLIAFSTSPGKTASDGVLRNGLYTESLLQQISKKELPIIQMFQIVRQNVLIKSNNSQLPWESTSLLGDFYFDPQSFNPLDTRIIKIRKEVSKLDESLFSFEKIEYEASTESSEGGVIFKYMSNSEIQKIEKQLYFEWGKYFQDLYFIKGEPLFYREVAHEYNVPINADEELLKELGHDEFDEDKTKILLREYFIEHNDIIGFNKLVENDKPEINEYVIDKVNKNISSLIESCTN
jgi:hypothetical protein